jgi:hypothetical protein
VALVVGMLAVGAM